MGMSFKRILHPMRRKQKDSSNTSMNINEDESSPGNADTPIISTTSPLVGDDSGHPTSQMVAGSVKGTSNVEDNWSNSLSENKNTIEASSEAPEGGTTEVFPASARDDALNSPLRDISAVDDGLSVKNEPPVKSTSTVENARSLWNQAYDILRSENPEQLDWYEQTLARWTQGRPSALEWERTSTDASEDNNSNVSKTQYKNERSIQINSWLHEGLEEEGEMPSSLLHLRSCLQVSAKTAPEAVLAWTGIFVSSQILRELSKTVQVPDSWVSGVIYVASRIVWYNSLQKVVNALSKGAEDISKDDCRETQTRNIETKVIDLYKTVIAYQVASLRSHDAALSTTDVDGSRQLVEDDTSQLDEIISAERKLWTYGADDLEDAIRESIMTSTVEAKEDTEHSSSTASSEDEDSSSTKSTLTDEEVSQLLSRLNATDPLEKTQLQIGVPKGFYQLLYQWIITTSEYQELVHVTPERKDVCTLGIRGGPGSGKTLISRAIMQGLSAEEPEVSHARHLSYAFCKIGPNEGMNAAGILKKLIYLIVNGQHAPKLAVHLDNMFKHTRRQSFDDPNDVYALSMTFYAIIRDDEFPNTLFLVDGLELCSSDEANTLFRIIRTSLELSSGSGKVKWILSADPTSFDFELIWEDKHETRWLDLDPLPQQLRSIFDTFYIPARIAELENTRPFEKDFHDMVTDRLREISGSNFLRVEIACDAVQRQEIWHAVHVLEQLKLADGDGPSDLCSLYSAMRKSIDNLSSDDQQYCTRVLSALAISYGPISIPELHEILHLPSQVDLRTIIWKRCFAFLDTQDDLVFFRKKSARDFILGLMQDRISQEHTTMVKGCLHHLTKRCVDSLRPDPPGGTSAPLTYSIANWLRHARDTSNFRDVTSPITLFLSNHLLEWLDLSTSTKSLSTALVLIRELLIFLKATCSDESDAERLQVLHCISETNRVFELHTLTGGDGDAQAKDTLLLCPEASITKQKLVPKLFPELEAWPSMEPTGDRPIKILEGHRDYVRSVVYSSDGSLLASASDDKLVIIWDATTGKAQHAFHDFDQWIYKVTISSSGFLAATDQTSIRVWNTHTGEAEKNPLVTDIPGSVDGSSAQISDVAFSGDGNTLAAGIETWICIWRLPDYRSSKWDSGQRLSFLSLSKDGSLLASASNSTITVWGTASGDRKHTLLHPDEDQGSITCLVVSSDARFVASASTTSNDVIVWDTEAGKAPMRLRGHRGEVQGVTFSGDDEFIGSASDDGSIRIWKAPWSGAPRCLERATAGRGLPMLSLSFSPSQRHVAASSIDSSIKIWDFPDTFSQQDDDVEENLIDSAEDQTRPHTNAVLRITLSPDGGRIASASSDGHICLWDAATGALLRTFRGHSRVVRSVMFSPDGQSLVSSSYDRTCRIWSINKKEEPRVLRGHKDWVRHAAFSHDGRFVASASDDETVRVWDTKNDHLERGNEPGVSPGQEPSESSESEDEVEGRHMKNGVQVLRGHNDYVTSLVFSMSGRYSLATGGNDGSVLVWELQEDPARGFYPSGTTMNRIKDDHDDKVSDNFQGCVYALQFMEKEKRLIASFSKGVRVWDLETRALLNIASIRRRNVYFSSMQMSQDFPKHLMTEEGPVVIQDLLSSSIIDTEPTDWCPYKIAYPDSDSKNMGCWITRDERKIIRIPRQYYPGPVRVYGHTVVFGCADGRMLFFRFK